MTTSETADNEVRRQRIRSVCEEHRSSRLHHPSPGFGKHLPSLRREDIHCYPDQCPVFVDDSRSLAFCFIDKVASTSLKTLFAKLLNVTVIGNESDALHWSFHSQTLRFGPRTLLGGERKDYFKARMGFITPFFLFYQRDTNATFGWPKM
ncbi:hypothetical protein HPB49_025257 [Dermacentor silvarum]|uniref:Uncharacterized protein n=1 Tax=Dermacentor silvarum TaxID=543639 RepID=A0ACB8DH74_DERSI|nr:hypothetical protein HPB49_025257 [Dermacentor silvarum]